MYLTYEELKTLDPSIKVTAEEWTAMSLQIDAMVDRLTFDVIGQRSVMSIPTLAEKVKRAVAVEARTIVTRGGLDACAKASQLSSRTVNVGGISESVSYQSDSSGEDWIDGIPVSKVAVSLLSKITALGRQTGGV